MLGFGATGQFAIGEGPARETITIDKWLPDILEPVRFKVGLPISQQQTSALTLTLPNVFFGQSGPMPIFEWRLLYQAFSSLPLLGATLTFSNSFSMPVFEWRLIYQALSTYLPRLLPNPSITGTLNATETRDVFLGGATHFDRVVSGEIGVIESSFTGAEIGVIEQALSPGTSGVAEMAVAPATGSAVPIITSGHVSIRIV